MRVFPVYIPQPSQQLPGWPRLQDIQEKLERNDARLSNNIRVEVAASLAFNRQTTLNSGDGFKQLRSANVELPRFNINGSTNPLYMQVTQRQTSDFVLPAIDCLAVSYFYSYCCIYFCQNRVFFRRNSC